MGINTQIHGNKDDSKKAALLGSIIIHFFKPQIKSKIKITPLIMITIRNIRILPWWTGKERKKETNKQCIDTTGLMDQNSIYVYYHISKKKYLNL